MKTASGGEEGTAGHTLKKIVLRFETGCPNKEKGMKRRGVGPGGQT